jgi:hypothetical protein
MKNAVNYLPFWVGDRLKNHKIYNKLSLVGCLPSFLIMGQIYV